MDLKNTNFVCDAALVLTGCNYFGKHDLSSYCELARQEKKKYVVWNGGLYDVEKHDIVAYGRSLFVMVNND